MKENGTDQQNGMRGWDMPPVFQRYYVFVGWMLDRAGKFPKNARFTFGQTLTNTLLGIQGKIVRAAYG